jgi:RimJ/RimL family protein N-acetyltransferase
VLEKLGFRREGTLRGYFQLEGEWVDNYLFAIVKEDWLLQRSRRDGGVS